MSNEEEAAFHAFVEKIMSAPPTGKAWSAYCEDLDTCAGFRWDRHAEVWRPADDGTLCCVCQAHVLVVDDPS